MSLRTHADLSQHNTTQHTITHHNVSLDLTGVLVNVFHIKKFNVIVYIAMFPAKDRGFRWLGKITTYDWESTQVKSNRSGFPPAFASAGRSELINSAGSGIAPKTQGASSNNAKAFMFKFWPYLLTPG